MADGRTRAYVNDQPVGVQVLRGIGSELVEIHGQHDDRALADPTEHRALLDAFGGLEGPVGAVREAHAEMRRARIEFEQESERLQKARTEADYLRHASAELGKLAARPGEEEALAARRTTMQQAAKVAGEIRDAHQSVAGDHSPVAAFASTLRRLERRSQQAPELITPSLKALDAALQAIALAGDALERALEDCKFDPAEFDRVEERLFALRAASRKYSVPAEALPALAERFAADLAALDAGEAKLVRLKKQVLGG